MTRIPFLLFPALLATLPLVAAADSWKHGHHKYKEEYWDGNCKVERKIGKHGEFKEERKCRAPEAVYYAPQPVYVAPPPPVVVQPGVTIQGTVRLP
ncbi:hypothetical protein SAMN06265795_103253 [Noviherbaspirillum humi]|uniref:Membrane lipoprotein, cell wall extensin motif n=1 Tax=Noviherbaspirillum humi TaxID=1688639 RepID=A0A239F9T6_9BURK|nr:hypothetical protein [Noviherbaspirillum humi]SNS53565.1 hypothetical protein SAMN06265795_103253 [Noviherbaspirillum humi]